MPFNGSGTFNRNHNWTADRDAGAPDHFINAPDMDDEFDNYKAGLEAVLTRDGQNAATAALPMGGFNHTNVGDATARNNYASAGQVQDSTLIGLTSVAGTDTITATAALSMSAYATNQHFVFIAAGTNTGATTLNLNSIGAKAIQKNGAALVAGDITANDAVVVVYDGTQFQMVSPARTPVLTDGGVPIAKLADGTDGELISWDASGNIATVAAGTSGQVLTSNGAGAAPTFQTSGGGLILLGTATASSSTSIDIGSGLDIDVAIDSTYDRYLITYDELVPGTDGVALYLRLGNGGAFDSGASDYAWIGVNMTGASTVNGAYDAADAQIPLFVANGVGSAAGESASGHAWLHAPADTSTNTLVTCDATFISNVGVMSMGRGHGSRLEAAAHDRARLLMSVGNIASGEIKIYGVKKT